MLFAADNRNPLRDRLAPHTTAVGRLLCGIGTECINGKRSGEVDPPHRSVIAKRI